MTLENSLYVFGDLNEATNTAIIEITDGEFSGVKYCYQTIKLAEEENEDGTIDLTFEYEVVEKPEGFEHDLENPADEIQEKFGNVLGDILVDVVTNAALEATGENQSAD